jgi:hypothetical protein
VRPPWNWTKPGQDSVWRRRETGESSEDVDGLELVGDEAAGGDLDGAFRDQLKSLVETWLDGEIPKPDRPIDLRRRVGELDSMHRYG